MTYEIIKEIKEAIKKRQTQIVLKLLNDLDAEMEKRLGKLENFEKDQAKKVEELKYKINKKFDEMRKVWYKTENPEIAKQRMNDSSWINIIDDIDEIFGVGK